LRESDLEKAAGSTMSNEFLPSVEQATKLDKALAILPPKQRAVVTAYLAGTTLRAYAVANEFNLNSVETNFKLGVAKIKQIIGGSK
jgi:DNA-directed RNA polymerase specialized sigma24 family protein